MADPLSFAASLIAVAQVSGSIISLCYEYQKSAKGARETIAQVLRETQSMRNVIEQLVQLLDDNDHDAEGVKGKSANTITQKHVHSKQPFCRLPEWS